MKHINQFILEAQNEGNGFVTLTNNSLRTYYDFVKKYVSSDTKKVFELLLKLQIYTKKDLDLIKNGSKLATSDEQDLNKLLKKIKDEYKILPQNLSQTQYEAVLNKKINVKELTLDFVSNEGRNRVAKEYTPLVIKIAKQVQDKFPNMTFDELVASGMLGLTYAMDNWKSNPAKGEKTVSFLQYASYRIYFQIQTDSMEFYQALSGLNYKNINTTIDKWGQNSFIPVRLDQTENEAIRDRIEKSLEGVDDISKVKIYADSNNPKDPQWGLLFSDLEKHFPAKTLDIFYRFFGLAGREQTKGVDLAKEYGTSQGNLTNTHIKKVLDYIKKNRFLMGVLKDLYTESLLVQCIDLDKNQILEKLSQDDMYLYLVESNNWFKLDNFVNDLDYALSMMPKTKDVVDVLGADFDYLDKNINKYKKDLMLFCQKMFPHKIIRTDGDIIEYMTELQTFYQEYNGNSKLERVLQKYR